jgi:hypothetical protein
MADEYAKPPYKRDLSIPTKYTWPSLKAKRGSELEAHYIELLRALGARKDVLGQIFTKAQNKIQDPAKLYRLIDMIAGVQWLTMGDAAVDCRFSKAASMETRPIYYLHAKSQLLRVRDLAASYTGWLLRHLADCGCGRLSLIVA